jgi:hypothetical protein
LYFALWQQTFTAVTEQVADFYEVNEANLSRSKTFVLSRDRHDETKLLGTDVRERSP